MLAAYRNAIDVHWYRHDKTRCLPVVARHGGAAAASAVKLRAGAPADSASGQQRAAATTLHHAGLHALPLGSTVLKPDFDLDLAEAQLAGDHRALGQRQILLAVELLLELEQLVAGERRASSSMSAAAAADLQTGSRRQGGRGLGGGSDVVWSCRR